MQAKNILELGKKFNVDEIYATESSFIENLKSAEDFQLVEVPTNGPLTFDDKLFEVCKQYYQFLFFKSHKKKYLNFFFLYYLLSLLKV